MQQSGAKPGVLAQEKMSCRNVTLFRRLVGLRDRLLKLNKLLLMSFERLLQLADRVCGIVNVRPVAGLRVHLL